MDKIKLYTYYIIIGIVSLIALVFLPMVGSTVGLGFNVPNTIVGWIVWVATKLIVATLNVLIFYCFMEQAKVNVKDNPKFLQASSLLEKTKDKRSRDPRSPSAWTKVQYGKKGTTIFVTTMLATIALTQAILTFDYVTMLTYLFTIVMGLIFGVIQMKSAEVYWTDEYYRYALMVEKENKEKEEDNKYEAERKQEARMEPVSEGREDSVQPQVQELHGGVQTELESGNNQLSELQKSE